MTRTDSGPGVQSRIWGEHKLVLLRPCLLAAATLCLLLTFCLPEPAARGPTVPPPTPTAPTDEPGLPARSPTPDSSPTSGGAARPTRVPTLAPSPTPASEAPPPATPVSAPPPPTPEGQSGPLVYPPGVNPLTGLAAPDPADLNRRPLAVKISNFPPCVRPQSGLSAADLVFEHYAEGGATRFTAIFYGQNPGPVGSVRSARLIDLELPAMYQALFAFSGASDGLLALLREADFAEYQLTPEFEVGCPPFCRRPLDKTPCGLADIPLLEHSLYSTTRDLWAYADSLGINDRPTLTGMVFNPEPPPGGLPGERLTLNYTGSFVQWLYDSNQELYYRRQDGSSHLDANTDLPITAANVAVVFAPHVVTDILEDTVGYNPETGEGGHYSVQIQLWQVGPAILFRDGQAYQVTWTRFSRDAELGLVFTADQYLPFKPGNTWFQVAPLASEVSSRGAAWLVKPERPPDTPFGP